MKVTKVKISNLKSHPENPNTHPDNQLKELQNSLDQFEQVKNIVVWKGKVIAGNGLMEAARLQNRTEIEVQDVSDWPEEKAISFMIADNRLQELAIMDNDILSGLITNFDEPLNIPGIDEDLLDSLDFGDQKSKDKNNNEHISLSENFIVPPFSIFDTKKGYWIERKRWWLEKINDRGESRNDTLSNVKIPDSYHSGKGLTHVSPSFSLLDPVLSEIVNLWFAWKNCKTFDCFAGDTVFGYVSAFCGNTFTGIELRKEQAELNQQRCDRDSLPAIYICDDGRNIDKHIKPLTQDLLFSCPPYFDLEIYSKKINDASNQKTYEDFYKIINDAFVKSIDCLKEDRFAVIVCGDIRNRLTGGYFDFPGDIKNTFKEKGCILYNEIIMAERIGTACMKAASYMKNRKVVKTHQNILVFYKGNAKNIKNHFKVLNEINEERIQSIESTDVEQILLD